MAGHSGGFGDDPLPPDSYSQLLFGDDDEEISCLDDVGFGGFTSNVSPKMLCFGDYGPNQNLKSISSNKRKAPSRGTTSTLKSTATRRHAKGAKKEKLGDRITALQQLVSPFGKTDTASVLHEAFGYIGFLQDQVHVLCSPYLQRLSQSQDPRQPVVDLGVADDQSKKVNNDLRSRGLCLVPMELTLHVADSNGADLWSSVALGDR